jgi:hypothetical protein
VIPNLHVLDENSDVVLNGWIRVMGVGGNFIHWNFFETLERYGKEGRTYGRKREGKKREGEGRGGREGTL